MPLYRYEATDRAGKQLMGAMDAADEGAVDHRLREGGFTLTRIVAPAVASGPAVHGTSAAPVDTSVPAVAARHLALFFRQLATLTRSGISLYQALDELAARTAQPHVSRTAREMAEAARQGERISDVMARYPRLYPDHVVGTVRAGELGGFVEVALDEIATGCEREVEFYRYAWLPKWLVAQAVVALAIGQAMMPALWPEPRWGLFIRLVLLRNLPIAAALIGAGFLLLRWLQEPAQRDRRDRLALKAPVFGDLARQHSLAAFVRMLRRLYAAGLGPAAAWQGAMNVVPNAVIRGRLLDAYTDVESGRKPIHDAFRDTGLFANETEQLLATGVLSGQVVEMLDRVSDYYQGNVERARKQAQFAMLRMGITTTLVLSGALLIYLVHAYYTRSFEWVEQFFGTGG